MHGAISYIRLEMHGAMVPAVRQCFAAALMCAFAVPAAAYISKSLARGLLLGSQVMLISHMKDQGYSMSKYTSRYTMHRPCYTTFANNGI